MDDKTMPNDAHAIVDEAQAKLKAAGFDSLIFIAPGKDSEHSDGLLATEIHNAPQNFWFNLLYAIDDSFEFDLMKVWLIERKMTQHIEELNNETN